MSLFPPVDLRHTRKTTTATSRYRRTVAALTAVGIAALASPWVTAKTDGEIAPVHRAAQPIKDAQGRIQMIVDFDFDPKEDTEFENTMSPADAKTWDKQQGKVVNLINQYETKFGFTRSGMTSWAKVSATAFLDENRLISSQKTNASRCSPKTNPSV